jgi:hypothetical protein
MLTPGSKISTSRKQAIETGIKKIIPSSEKRIITKKDKPSSRAFLVIGNRVTVGYPLQSNQSG